MKKSVLRGVTVQSTRVRIRPEERDSNLFYYEMRHGDQESTVCTVEKDVTVNFYGTVVAEKEIPLDTDEPQIFTDANGNEQIYQFIGIHFDEERNKNQKKAVGNRSYDKNLKPWDH